MVLERNCGGSREYDGAINLSGDRTNVGINSARRLQTLRATLASPSVRSLRHGGGGGGAAGTHRQGPMPACQRQCLVDGVKARIHEQVSLTGEDGIGGLR